MAESTERRAAGSERERESARIVSGVLTWRERIGWPEVLVALVAWQALQIPAVLGLAALGVGLAGSGGLTQTGTLWVLAVSAATAPLAVGAALLMRRRFTFASIGLRPTTWRWLLVGVGVGVLAWVVSRVVVFGYVALTGDDSNPQQFLADVGGGAAWQFALLVLLGGLLVPFGEELLFRGLLYTWLRRWGVVVALAVSSLVFGLVHGLHPGLLIAITLIGGLCAVVYERSGSLWPAIVVHAVNNMLVFATILALRLSGVEF